MNIKSPFRSEIIPTLPISQEFQTTSIPNLMGSRTVVEKPDLNPQLAFCKLETSLMEAKDSRYVEHTIVKYCDYPALKNHLQEDANKRQVDLSDENSILESLQSIGFNADILKSSRWNNDAVIIKLIGQGQADSFAVKIHPDVFPLCSHIYCDDTVERINMSGATTNIKDTFIVTSKKRQFRVVVYNFLEGTPLKKAMSQNKISRDLATEKLIELERKLSSVKTYLVLRDQNDFLLLNDGSLLLTDWNAIVDVSKASEDALQGYSDFKAGCIKGFMKSTEEYDKK